MVVMQIRLRVNVGLVDSLTQLEPKPSGARSIAHAEHVLISIVLSQVPHYNKTIKQATQFKEKKSIIRSIKPWLPPLSSQTDGNRGDGEGFRL
ncbi:hypothetical protein KOW79_001269 [Hemibagrus wyckioides]|uniref:Uncharacterized protein n=1 Tax=Hemibagrus wyckioides TaxID=337641 RepID=A0A9D3P4U2_9TELE|nr:hypothetical protein KOW79_001269 [Hemibagrus wyckioides]